jgi:glyoxylase-like metal-dependent hydrolase (beta-lactamase superfamily II)
MKVGRIEILSLLDGLLVHKFPADKPLPKPESTVWEAQHGSLQPDGTLETAIGAFVVRTGDRIVLVDAGGGQELVGGYRPPTMDPDDPDDPLAGYLRGRGMPEDRIRQFASDMRHFRLTQGQLPASLESAGVRREDVTDLVFTHLHSDHIGWVSVDGEPYFPNAAIRVSDADLQYFLPGTEEDWFSSQLYHSQLVPDRFDPVLDRIETWESDRTILPGIDVRLAPGHTPGSSVIVVSSGSEKALLLGDVVHCPLELMDDDFNLLADYDQELANRARRAYAQELEGTDIPVSAAHFPGLRFGRLLPGEGVRRWSFDA